MEKLILSGTIRHVDIIPALYVELTRKSKDASVSVFRAYGRVIADALRSDVDADLESDEIMRVMLILELLDRLSDVAGDDMYFGSRACDESHFGYWYLE